MSTQSTVLTQVRDGICMLTMNRALTLNALNREMAAAIVSALKVAAEDPGVSAVVMVGSGDRAFCAGVDLKEAQALTVPEIAPWFECISACYRQILLVDKPIVSAVNGVAAGGGYQMTLVSDWRIGHNRTRMAQPEINAGLPSIMGSYLMRFHLPWSVNQELSYTGRAMYAEECRRLGLLNEIVEASELLDAALMRARALAGKSAVAFRATKARFREFALSGFDEARDAAIRGIQAAYVTGDPQAQMARFLAKQNG